MKEKFTPVLKKTKRFFNPHKKVIRRNLWNILLWKLGYYDETFVRKPPSKDFKYPVNKNFQKHLPSCVWINHSTFLIKLGDSFFLTDPIWSKYCSPFPLRSLKRKHKPAIELDELPKVCYILISHDHYDHLDKKTVKKLHAKFPNVCWIIPLNLSKWFQRLGIDNLVELSWWEEKVFSEDLKITAVPSQHFSGRSFFSMNKTLWNGYVIDFIKENKRFYFAGDTGYNEVDFKAIGENWQGMDLSLLPIGTYCPRPFMGPVHVDPMEAVQIHLDVKSISSVGMHWKTFCLSDEPLNLPPYDLYLAMEKAQLSHDQFLAIDPGVYVNW